MTPYLIYATLRRWRNEDAEVANLPRYRIAADFELWRIACESSDISSAAWAYIGCKKRGAA